MASVEQSSGSRRGGPQRIAKLTGFAILAIGFVICAAMFISIIQFQLRITEAKNQSKSFSLISLSQMVTEQKELGDSVEFVQKSDDLMANYDNFTSFYVSELAQIANLLCNSRDKPEDRQSCTAGIYSALMFNASALQYDDTISSQQYVYQVISRNMGVGPDQLPADIKPIAEAATKLADARNKFVQTNGPKIVQVKMNCGIVERYFVLSDESNTVAIYIRSMSHGTNDDQGRSILDSMARDYVVAARLRCSAFKPGISTAAAAIPVAPTNPKVETVSDQAPSPVPVPESKLPSLSVPESKLPGGSVNSSSSSSQNSAKLQADLSNALLFDLISYYRFYEKVLGSSVTGLAVIAPIDITFILLVILCGGLGAMLRIAAEFYDPKLFGKTHEDPGSKVIYSFVLGVMCALIIYILARTVYAGLGESSYSSRSGELSPFVTAFLAIVSGLICEEAFQQIIIAGKAMLARSTGGSSGENTQKGAQQP
jgi:hypothetical protein